MEDLVIPLEQSLHYDPRNPSKRASPSLMESSTRWWPRPLRHDGSQEPQIESAEAPEDELDPAGRKHAVKPLIRSRADIFAFSQSLNRLDWSAPFHGGFRAIVSLLTSRFP